MPDDVTNPTPPPAQPATPPAQGGAPSGVTFTAEQQEQVNRIVAATKREHESKLEAVKADYESKLKSTPQSKPTDADLASQFAALKADLAFSEAMQDLAAEIGPVAPEARARLRKLATVDKPPDLVAWLRTETKALGLVKAPAAPAVAIPGLPAPMLPANGGAPASAPALDLNGPLTPAALMQPGAAQAVATRSKDGWLAVKDALLGSGGSNGRFFGK